MTLHTPKAPETTVQRMVTNAMHVQNIEVETGWTRDDIKACAMRMGYALDAASQRFRRAPQRKPAPAGIVLASQTSTGAADTGQPASDPSHDRDTNRGRGGEPSSSVPVLPGPSAMPAVPDSTGAAEKLLGEVKKRKSALTTLQLHILDRAVATIIPPDWDTYLVGTAHTGGEYRDVDVRTILPDEEFDAVFRLRRDLWGSWCFAVGSWLAMTTALPIDYQVQRRTEANAKYPGPGNRNPLGLGRQRPEYAREYAGGGDATRFADATETSGVGSKETGTANAPSADDPPAAPEPAPPTKRPGNYPTGPRLTHGATQSQIRDWARTQGLDVNPRGTVRRDIADAYAAAHQETP